MNLHINREQINCITEKKYKSQMELFCWTHGTHLNERLLNETNEIGIHVVNYGVGRHVKGDTYIHQYYYQWVVPVLLLQAFVFFIPRLLWKTWENGRLQKMCSKIGR